jgi:hypothetical protein
MMHGANNLKISVDVTFKPSIDTGILNETHTCPGYRENANPNTKITMTPKHAFSL